MSFVDGDSYQLSLGVDCVKQFTEMVHSTELRCDVEQASFRMTAFQVGNDTVPFGLGGIG